MSPARLNHAQQAPNLFNKFVAFSQALQQSSLDLSLRDLVMLRASQLNACTFCVDMHVKEATIHGERALRLHHVAVWRESPLFSARERAALAWVELLTNLPPHGVSDADYLAVREHFKEAELAELGYAIVLINGWNRLAVGFAAQPGALDKVYGLDKAGLH